VKRLGEAHDPTAGSVVVARALTAVRGLLGIAHLTHPERCIREFDPLRTARRLRPLILWVFVIAMAAPGDDGSGLKLSDLAPYRAALEHPADGPAVAVTFRALWEHPERFESRRVSVEGRVMRRFRQGPVGTFPPLEELWAVNPAGDPFCLVFPAANSPASPAEAASTPGAVVRFDGTFLKQIRYRGGDTARLAPLIVGDRPPTVVTPARKNGLSERAAARSGGWVDWALGLAAAGFVALVLARRHMSRPSPPPIPPRQMDPPPEFVNGG
jgi:hypothetical protein